MKRKKKLKLPRAPWKLRRQLEIHKVKTKIKPRDEKHPHRNNDHEDDGA